MSEISQGQRREFQEALLDADAYDDLPGKWQAAIPYVRAAPAEPDTPPKPVAAWAWG